MTGLITCLVSLVPNKIQKLKIPLLRIINKAKITILKYKYKRNMLKVKMCKPKVLSGVINIFRIRLAQFTIQLAEENQEGQMTYN